MSSVLMRTLKSCAFVASLAVTAACGGGDGDGERAQAGGGTSQALSRMPNVIGQTEAAARQAVAAAGLTAGIVHVSGTAGGAEPMVITQSPTAGGSVSSDTVVELVLASAPAGGEPPIRVTQRYPGSNTIVHNQFRSQVDVESLYELSAALTSIGGSAWSMTYWNTTPRPIFYADVDATGVPAGPQLLTTRVTDVRGNFSEVKVTIIHDVPATLRVASPVNESVALPTLPVDVTCIDDFSGCEVQLFGPQGVLLAQGIGGVVATLDLSRWAGQQIRLEFAIYDSASQLTRVPRNILVETSPRLSHVITYPGRILDFDGDRALTLEPAESHQPSIHSLSMLTREPIPWPSGWYVDERFSRLTPSGALLGALGGFTSQIRPQLGVHLWRGGHLTALPISVGSPVAGDYAVFDNGPGLYRFNIVSGASTLVTTANIWPAAVATDGAVIFTNLDGHLVRDRAGQQTVLADEPFRAHIEPQTNGHMVVYTQRAARVTSETEYATAIILGSAAPTLLTPFSSQLSACFCAISGDWLVFANVGAQQQRQLYRRDPQGVITQMTDFLGSSTIDRLAGNGDVMFTSGGQRYLSRGAALIPISGPAGKSYWFDDNWYIAMGATLLAVDTSDLQAP